MSPNQFTPSTGALEVQNLKIEKGVPPPKGATTNKYPFGEMDVGDSIVVPSSDGTAAGSKVYRAAIKHGQYHGRTYTGRVEDRAAKTVRIWRIK